MDKLYGMRVIAAVSGGADSVALLLRLCRIRAEGKIALIAAHVEHGIRGGASVSDMEFTRRLCRSLNVPLFIRRCDVPSFARENKVGTETAARILRYRYFEELLDSTGFDRVALAHHADDQAETVLMHLLRGASLTGAAGMRYDSGRYVRPLLGIRKAQLEEEVRRSGHTFVTDETNFEADNPRNALRRLLSGTERFYPGAVAALNRFGALCARDDDCLSQLASRETEVRVFPFCGGVRIERSGLHEALLARVAKPYLSDADAEEIASLTELEGRHSLSGGLTAYGHGGDLFIYRVPREAEPVKLALSGRTVFDGRFVFEISEACGIIRENGLTQTVNAAALENAQIRYRRDGDRIRPFGMTGEKLLSDYLIDRKVPLPVRETLPVIAHGSGILWVPGIGLSEKLRVSGKDGAVKIKFGRLE